MLTMESARNLTRVSRLVCTCAVASVASKAASLVGLGSCGGQESRFLTRWTLLFYYKDAHDVMLISSIIIRLIYVPFLECFLDSF